MKPIRQSIPGTSEAPDTVEIIVQDYLGRIRRQFYPDNDKHFFQQRRMLIKAITWPAAWLKKRGVTWPAEQYRSCLDEIILGIQRHGSTAQIGFFPRYFLHCVQQHFAHNDESFYDIGKSHRDRMSMIGSQLLAGIHVKDSDPVQDLANLHDLVKGSTKRVPKARSQNRHPADPQQTLF